MAPFLELSRISRDFDGVRALVDIDLSLAVGEIHCLVGENGSGKSTLIKVIAGVERPEPGGTIRVGGRDYPYLTPVQSTRFGIQVIYQDLSLFPHLTVAENIAIGRHLGGFRAVRWKALGAIARQATARVGVSLDLYREVVELSIAERQLVAICRAIAADARLIIMDEPTASLTRIEVGALLGLARDLSKEGIAIVFVSHKLNEVMAIAERVTVLRDGHKVGTFDAKEITGNRLSALMTGKEFAYGFAAPEPAGAPIVLSSRGLRRAGEFEEVSIEVHAGEILGIIGRLGSGRTELALALFGLAPADAGEIRINGALVPIRSNRDAIAGAIAYVPEDRIQLGLVMEQPIATNIVLPILSKVASKLGFLLPRLRRATARRWLDELGIKTSDGENAVKTLSGGNQQRVVLAKWLATNPRILILDNPTVGVDINAKDGIYAIMQRLAQAGMAIILISDEVPEVLHQSHRILIMREGRITGDFLAASANESQIEAAIDA